MGKAGIAVTQDRKANISFLISMFEDKLAYAQSKNKGTKAPHMQLFFDSMSDYIKNDLHYPSDGVIHLLDNCRGGKNIEMFNLLKKNKIKIAFQPG